MFFVNGRTERHVLPADSDPVPASGSTVGNCNEGAVGHETNGVPQPEWSIIVSQPRSFRSRLRTCSRQLAAASTRAMMVGIDRSTLYLSAGAHQNCTPIREFFTLLYYTNEDAPTNERQFPVRPAVTSWGPPVVRASLPAAGSTTASALAPWAGPLGGHPAHSGLPPRRCRPATRAPPSTASVRERPGVRRTRRAGAARKSRGRTPS